MQARHGQKAAERTGPERTEPPEHAPTDAEALDNLREGLGPFVWERGFRRAKGPNGETVYVDETTGQMFDHLPRLNRNDGKPDDLPRKG